MKLVPKAFFSLCLTVSLLIHAAVSLFVDPVIKSKGDPVVQSWLDLLDPGDLSSSPGAVFQTEWYLPFDTRQYLLSSFLPERLRFVQNRRKVSPFQPFSDFKRCRPGPVNYKRNIVASLDLYEPKTATLEYKTAVTAKGRLLFAAPSTLAFNSPSPFEVEEKLRDELVFLGKGSFYWTRVKVMIE